MSIVGVGKDEEKLYRQERVSEGPRIWRRCLDFVEARNLSDRKG